MIREVTNSGGRLTLKALGSQQIKSPEEEAFADRGSVQLLRQHVPQTFAGGRTAAHVGGLVRRPLPSGQERQPTGPCGPCTQSSPSCTLMCSSIGRGTTRVVAKEAASSTPMTGCVGYPCRELRFSGRSKPGCLPMSAVFLRASVSWQMWLHAGLGHVPQRDEA